MWARVSTGRAVRPAALLALLLLAAHGATGAGGSTVDRLAVQGLHDALIVLALAILATSALQLADQRLASGKDHRRASAGAQAADALVRLLEEREPVLHSHGEDVARLAAAVAARLGLSPDQVVETRRAAELHDVGKVAVPDLILHKPGPLTSDERRFVEQHTVIGERILAAAPALAGVARVVRASHERWDGRGYPDGLTALEIPLGARIVAVCDAYDAMTTSRPYHRAVGHEEALEELRRCAGTQFDPRVVDALVAVGGSRPQPRSEPSRSLSST